MNNAINQTHLVHSMILMNSDYEIRSTVINETEFNESDFGTEKDAGAYDWYLVDVLDGTEEHVMTCLDSTWVGVLAA